MFREETVEALARRLNHRTEWIKIHLEELGYTQHEIDDDFEECVHCLKEFT